ncbi:tail fiber domain-containing protein [Pseudoalteromonas sp. XMcav1-K]|uniref:tail fiber domain-containing protein n=1 Tax=Pseudoalteromonas sp. XMcav1-K TaxID=3374372 RepID=UPI0037571740
MNAKNIFKTSALTTALLMSLQAQADQQISDNLIVQGSVCVGLDCNNGESFNFDTIRLKENNVRIKFQDTSSSASFPSNDWQLTANDSTNGGANRFSIDDIDGGKTPFTVEAGARTNALYIDDVGRIGVGTSAPIANVHIKEGNTPTLRLEQDGSSGFSAQTWDVAGNESNFFVRDATNSGTLPFRIQPGASNASIYIASDGDVGLETTSPDGQFDVAHSSNANNHAFLIDPSSNVGVNIDNGYTPNGLFDVQTTGGQSQFIVQSDGDVGIGTSSPDVTFEAVGSKSSRTDTLAKLRDNDPSTDPKLLLNLENNGPAWIGLDHTADQDRWLILRDGAGDFRISKQNYADLNAVTYLSTFQLDSSGNLTIPGNLTANGTTYTSSIMTKENFSNLNLDTILDGVSSLNISQWNYIKDGSNIKHIGPIAEDFHKVFGLNGTYSDRISITDIAGVSLAAIQALKNQLDTKTAQIEALEQKVNALSSN